MPEITNRDSLNLVILKTQNNFNTDPIKILLPSKSISIADSFLIDTNFEAKSRTTREHPHHYASFLTEHGIKTVSKLYALKDESINDNDITIILTDDILIAVDVIDRCVEHLNENAKANLLTPFIITNLSKSTLIPQGLNLLTLNEYLFQSHGFECLTKGWIEEGGFLAIVRTEFLLDAVNRLDNFKNTAALGELLETWALTIQSNASYMVNSVATSVYFSKEESSRFPPKKVHIPKTFLINPAHQEMRWRPLTGARETFRNIRTQVHLRNWRLALKQAAQGLIESLFYFERRLNSTGFKQTKRTSGKTVTYVLHNLAVAGGVISVVQLVNQLIVLGVNVNLVCLFRYRETYDWPLYAKPIVYKDSNDLINNFPPSDIAVATHWTTAKWVEQVVKKGKARHSVYFLQDFESWFIPKTNQLEREAVITTYDLIENKIVKSDWLQEKLADLGHKAKKIPFGLDLSVFYPRTRHQKDPSNIVIIAMARPGTPRRGFNTLIAALDMILSKYPAVQCKLFGENLSGKAIPFKFTALGVLSSQSAVAEEFSKATIFIDASDFQGFGRTALEAMGTNTACVLSNHGGVNEYAIDCQNCILVPPRSPEAIFEAVAKLLNNKPLLDKVVTGGLATAYQFSHVKEAELTAQYFETL